METSLAIKILNLKEALLLYDLIGKHIPTEIAKEVDILNFVGKIVDNVVEAKEYKSFIEVLMLFTGKEMTEVLDLPKEEAIIIFSSGLVQNDIILLCGFCEELKYGRSE